MANVLFNYATPCHLDGNRQITITFLRVNSAETGQQVQIYGYYYVGSTRVQLFSQLHYLTAQVSQTKTITVGIQKSQAAMEDAMPNSASIPLQIKLVCNGESWGEGELVVTKDLSGPTLSSITVSEGNPVLNTLLSGAYFLTNESMISIDTSNARAQNNASIVRRLINVAGQAFTLTGNQTVQTGIQISEPGDYPVTVVVVDSRGFHTVVTQTITVRKYTPVIVYGDSISRLFNVGTSAHFEFSGNYTDLVVSGTHKNSVSVTFSYKKTNTQNYTNITLTPLVSNNSYFSYNDTLPITFDESSAYDIRLIVTDAISNLIYRYTLPKAVPIIALRDEKVGINKTAPTCALDVHGNIKGDGSLTVNGNIVGSGNLSVTGIETTITTDTQKNNLTTPGIYWVAASDVGYYMIEVFAFDNTIIQRETMRGFNNGVTTTDVYVRSKIGSGNWTSWQQL